MADTNINAKKLNTRIKLKYDTYENWQSSSLTLLKGEIAICEIPGSNPTSVAENGKNLPVNSVPTVLFKVGDGEKTFSQLPWASAKAADVHAWAKASAIKLVGTALKFVDANGQAINGIDPIELGNTFATDAEVETIRAALASQIADINAALGTSGSGIGNDVAELKAAVAIINGAATVEGSIAKAKADAISTAANDATTKANNAKSGAEAAAKSYTDTEVGKDRTRIGNLETLTGGHTTSIADNTRAIGQEVTDRKAAITGVENAYKAADTAINNKIGAKTDAATTDTIYGAIAAAKAEGTAAKNSIATLTGTNGDITKNTAGVAQNKADIAALAQTVNNNKTALENADKDLDARLDKIELFFADADADNGTTNNLNNALDSLKEIQKFITDEGTAADNLATTVGENTEAIAGINASLAEGGTIGGAIKANTANISGLSGRMDTAEDAIDDLSDEIDILQAATTGFDATTTIAARFESVEGTLSTTTGTANDAKSTANTNKAALENLTKDGGRISAIEGDVSNAKSDITNLKAVTNGYSGTNAILNDVQAAKDAASDAADAADAAAQAASAADQKAANAAQAAATADGKAVAAQNTANTANELAGSNQTKIAAIEADYLTKADFYVIDCGDADENDFDEPTA